MALASFTNKQIERMYFKALDLQMAERAEQYLDILRERLSKKNPLAVSKGLVLELREVREHDREGVTVSEHIKGFWVKPTN